VAEASAESRAVLWGGGVNPYGVEYKKLGMWLFILSDSLTFAAALFGYSYLRFASPNWPTPFPFSPSILFATLMTLVLLTSSLTMVKAVHHALHGEEDKAPLWIWLTAALGLTFIVLHATEWRHLFHEGITLKGNPMGDAMFGGTFFTITGLHMFHVFSGVCYLAFLAVGVKSKRFKAIDVEVAGLYWHFVDLVWMFVFPLLYLMSVDMSGGH
jgi:cytochrome c oxidase subunit 3